MDLMTIFLTLPAAGFAAVGDVFVSPLVLTRAEKFARFASSMAGFFASTWFSSLCFRLTPINLG